MTDATALLHAIRENPAEDTPRLAYADWLDEFGTTDVERARAVLIRLQIERAGIGERRRPPLAARSRELDKEITDLLAQFRDEWLSNIPVISRYKHLDHVFKRGFVNYVSVDANQNRISATSPSPWHREPVGYLALTGAAEVVERVLRSRWIEGLNSLNLAFGRQVDIDAQIAASVAVAPFCVGLRHLGLTHWHFPDQVIRELVGSPHLLQLRELHLAGEFSSAGWAALVNSPLADQLEYLYLASWVPHGGAPDRRRIGPEAAVVLASAERLANLRRLNLIANRLGVDGLRAILSSEHLGRLGILAINGESLSASGRVPFGTRVLPNLEQLWMASCQVSPDTLRGFGACGLLAQLKLLHLVNEPLSQETIQALLDGHSGPYRLEVLTLVNTGIGDEGVKLLARSDRFPKLWNLDLSLVGMTDVGAEAILNAPWADQLERLELVQNALSPAMHDRLQSRFGDVVAFGTPRLQAPPPLRTRPRGP